MTIIGTAGNDHLNGTAKADKFNLAQGGDDSARGKGGNDTFIMGAAFGAHDRIDGGAGADTLFLKGNYGKGLTFGKTTLTNVEAISLAGGFNYKLATHDKTVAAGKTLTIDGHALGPNKTLVINGAKETNGHFNIIGGAGNDSLTGGARSDVFGLHRGGNDVVKAGGGNDTVNVLGALTALDSIDGGNGVDRVNLNGDYSAGLVLAPSTLTRVEQIGLAAGHGYSLTTSDANVAAGTNLLVDGSALGAGFILNFNAAAETDGSFALVGGAGNDGLTGGGGNDGIDLHLGGNDTADGGAGNDSFILGGTLTAADAIDGGAGIDVVKLDGDYVATLTLGPTSVVNVEEIDLAAGHRYDIAFDDATVAAGQTLIVDGSTLGAGDFIFFRGGAETNGRFNVTGGAGNDTFAGGTGNDAFDGGNGSDVFFLQNGGSDTANGGEGNDTFNLRGALNQADRIDGGAGSNDVVNLEGCAVVFNATTMTNVETIHLAGDFSYDLTTADATVAAGETLTIDGGDMSGATQALIFHGSAELDGRFHVIDSAGNDILFGGAQADQFEMSGGGDDAIRAGGGDDFLYFSNGLTSADQVDGEAGHDVLDLAGDYTGANALTFGALTITNIEVVELNDGHSYTLVTNDNNVAGGQTLAVNAVVLGSGDHLVFDGGAESDGSFSLTGGAGSDDLGGGAQDDLFDLGGGGDDVASGGTGSDTFVLKAALTADDRITGGSSLGDNDVVKLDGDYSGGLAFNATTMVQIEKIELAALHSYALATDDATVSGGQTLKVDGSALGASDSLTFDGQLETNGKFDVVGGAAGDTLTGGAQDDAFNLGHGGNDTVGGGGGDDVLDFGATLTDQDIIDGGSGTGDAVQIAGYYASGGLGALGLSAMTNVERLVLGNGVGFDYVISTVDATVAAGATLTIDATALSAQQSLSFDGSAESDGSFFVKSGGGSDDLTGGAQGDIFGYLGIALSSATRDTINNFDFGNDVIKFAAVTGIDAAVTAGRLDGANFDGDLAAIFGSGGSQPLGAQHAVLFTRRQWRGERPHLPDRRRQRRCRLRRGR